MDNDRATGTAPKGLRSSEDFQQLFNYDKSWAAKALRKHGTVSQMFVIHSRDGRAIPVVESMGGDVTCDNTHRLVRLLCQSEDAVAVATMGEAWIVIDPINLEVRPSKSSRRREVLVVMLRGRVPATGEPFSDISVLGIERGADGAVCELSDVPEVRDAMRDGAGYQDFISDLFAIEPLPAADRRKARAEAARMQKRTKRGKPPKFH